MAGTGGRGGVPASVGVGLARSKGSTDHLADAKNGILVEGALEMFCNLFGQFQTFRIRLSKDNEHLGPFRDDVSGRITPLSMGIHHGKSIGKSRSNFLRKKLASCFIGDDFRLPVVPSENNRYSMNFSILSGQG